MTPGDLPLHVEELGLRPAPDVETHLLIHGYGASAYCWRHWTPRLAARAHVLLVDLKGFGHAPKPRDGRYAPSDQAELVHRLIDARHLSNVTLIGHSLGGGVALLTALRLLDAGRPPPERLVLVAATAYEQELPPFVRFAEHPRMSSLLVRVLGRERIVRTVLTDVVHDRGMVDDVLVRGYAEPLASEGALGALFDAARQILPPDLDRVTRRYPELRVPTLLLWGRHDRVVPLGVGERLARELPDARLRVLEACGHLPAEELPDESYSVLETFLNEQGAAGSKPSHSSTGSSG